MAYITDSVLRNTIDVPISLPGTRVTANAWLVVATVPISGSTTAEFRFMLLQLLDAIRNNVVITLNDACNPVSIGLVNNNRGLAYLGIVKDIVGNSIDPATVQFVGTVADVISVSTQGVVVRDESAPSLIIDAPGNYSFVIINNCVDVDLRLLVSGVLRVNSS